MRSPVFLLQRHLNFVIPPLSIQTQTTPSPTAGNFLGIGAKKAKEMKSARRAAAVGLVAGGSRSSKQVKLAHTGSGFSLDQVVKMKYVKGFTQAVRTRCRLEDLE